MRVLLLSRNLLWTHRLERILHSSGHTPVAASQAIEGEFDAAIVHAGETETSPFDAIRALREKGVWVLAHAGHKEADLRTLAEEAGCSRFVTNRELVARLPEILGSVEVAR